MTDRFSTADTMHREYAEGQRSSRKVKRERVVAFLERHNLDGILLTLQSNFAWYTDGGRGHVSVGTEESIAQLLITRSEEHLYTDTTEHARLTREEMRWNFQQEHLQSWWDDERDRPNVAALFGRRIESDAGRLQREFARVRYSLLPEEVSRYRELGKDVAAACWDTTLAVRRGMTEFDLAAELSMRLMRNGVYPLVLMVGFDERLRSYRHPLPTMNRLKNTALISVCGRRSGLVASSSRLISLGPLSDDLLNRHRAAACVDAWLQTQTVPGALVAQIFEGVKEQYELVGYPNEWQLHHQGGATGYTTRDYRASGLSEEVVQDNQAFAWNPTITGTKSEETIIAKERGCEILTLDSRWPTLEVETNGVVVKRPDILVLG